VVSASKLLAEGATATANPGYHFVGWRRASDGMIVYAPGMDPATLTTASVAQLFAMAEAAGFNVLPDGTIDMATLMQVAQNTTDGFWHDEEYQALFAANAIAILHYDKNAEDAEGVIPDVEAPEGSLITLSDGSGFTRKHWTLVGWNTEADLSGITYALSETGWVMPAGETTLYAIWVKNPATLTYEPGGSDVTGIPEGVTDEWGTLVEVSGTTPKRPHYTFTGWLGSDGVLYSGGEELALLPEGITLTAQWKINTYEVTTGTPEGGIATVTGTDPLPYGTYVPEGYVTALPQGGYHLSGWRYTIVDEDGNVTTGVVSDPTQLLVTGKVTLSPIFEKDEEPAAKATTPATTEAGAAAPADVAPAGALPQTGDAGAPVAPLAAAGASLVFLALLLGRRRDDEEEAA
jgi:LPXTG-motif cell wall-anchored protein/uncharacterized repeat protein (TIGR02543 family)